MKSKLEKTPNVLMAVIVFLAGIVNLVIMDTSNIPFVFLHCLVAVICFGVSLFIVGETTS